MSYICLSCGTEYNKDSIVISKDGYESWCPALDCQENMVVEVDDLILPTIRILNQKGYNTTFCCSGHGYMSDSRNTYIAFEEDCVPDLTNIKLKGFVFENESPYCIRKWYDRDLSRSDFEMELYKTMIDLLEWANELIDLYGEDEDIYDIINERYSNDNGERLTTEEIIEKRNNK